MQKRFLIVILAALLVLLGSGGFAFAYERVPSLVAKSLRTTRGKPISSGLVFIDGKYLRPPYRVTRVGNQIQINDRPVTGQLIAWDEFVKTQKFKVTEVADEPAPDGAAGGGDAPPPERDGDDPAAPKDGGNAPPAADDASVRPTVRIVETRCAADDLDDFAPGEAPEKMKLSDIPEDSDADRARQKRAEDEKRAEEEEKRKESGESGAGERRADDSSAGADEDEIDPASPEGEAAAKRAAAAQKGAPKRVRRVCELDGAFEMNFRAQKLLKQIDAYRAKLEGTLRRGGYLFVGTGANGSKPYCHGRTSDAALTRELLKRLPELMARAEETEEFCDAVRSAGLFSYINLQISQDLFRHKADSVFLKQRRRELAEADRINRMVNSHGR